MHTATTATKGTNPGGGLAATHKGGASGWSERSSFSLLLVRSAPSSGSASEAPPLQAASTAATVRPCGTRAIGALPLVLVSMGMSTSTSCSTRPVTLFTLMAHERIMQTGMELWQLVATISRLLSAHASCPCPTILIDPTVHDRHTPCAGTVIFVVSFCPC